MITFLDENDVEYGALATIKATNAVNGERSLTGTIASGDYVLSNIERGWRLRFDDEYYVVTYAKPIDEGRDVQVEFDAVHQFFWDFDKSSVYDQLRDGSHTFVAYLDFIFKNSGYSYTVDSALNVYAFEKQSFGFKKRLTLFNDIITSTGVEFQVNGKVVRILQKVGTDLSTVVRKNFNMNELTIEKNIGDFVTYQKGFGAYFDEEDHSKGRLEVEYTSPLASVYGKLEAEPFVDERYSQSSSLLAALKENVDNSYTISVSLDMEDLTRAGYKYKQPIAGDYIMAINETLDFQEKIRIVSFASEYDVDGQLIKHTVTCNDIGSVKKLSASYNLTKKQASSASATASNAYSVANKALISADGKNTNYYGDSFPVDNPKGTLKKGDLLFLTVGDTVKQYYWNGADWVINPVLDDVEAFKEQIAEELKDVPNREEFENKIAEELATSKAEIETQIETAKTQAESNAKEYADTINDETAKVAELANAAAGEIKADLVNVKNNLTSTSLVANNAQAAVDAAKQELTNVNNKVDNAKEELTQAKQELANVASDLNTAKQDLADSVAEVNNKVDNAKAELTQTKQQLTTVADDLSQAKTDLQNAVSAVDTKATNLKSDLAQAKQDLTNQAQQLQAQANAQSELTKRFSSVEKTANGTKTTVNELTKTVAQNGKDITSVTARTKTVEDDLAGTKTTLSQVKTTADSASQKTATLESGLDGLTARFDNLKIGGANLLLYSADPSKAPSGYYDLVSAQKTSETYNGSVVYRVRDIWRGLKVNLGNLVDRDLLKVGDVLTYSVAMRADQETPIQARLFIRYTNQSGVESPTGKIEIVNLTADWQYVSVTFTVTAKMLAENTKVTFLGWEPTSNAESGKYVYYACSKIERGNIATDYSPSEVDLEQKVAEYKQNADQNYASLQTTVQNLDGTVQHNKTVADQTAQGFTTRIESLETYKDGETTRANQYFELAKTETARQLTVERTAIAKDYVAKSTYTSDVTGIRNELSATTSTANTTKTNLANYQASNDKMVASLKSSLQTTDGNVSNLQTKVEAVPGQITSAVSAVEGKIPTNVSTRNLILKSNDFAHPHKQGGANTTVTSTDGYFVLKSTGYTSNGWGGISWNMSISEVKAGEQFSILMPVYIDNSVPLDNGWTFALKNHNSNLAAYEYNIPTNKKDQWFNVAIAFKTTKDVTFGTYPFYVYLAKNGLVRIKPPMLVRGNLIPSDYQPAFEDTESDINAVSSELKQTADGMTLLATKTELNSAKTDLQSGINTATSKANNAQSTANSAQNKANSNAQTISTHTTQISALNTGLQAKVSQTDFNTLSGRVTSAENNITAKANELSSKISSVEGKIPTSVGGTNLLLYSADPWQAPQTGYYQSTNAYKTDETYNGAVVYKTGTAWGRLGINLDNHLVKRGLLKVGDVLTYSVLAKTDQKTPIQSRLLVRYNNQSGVDNISGKTETINLTNEWQKVSVTFTVTEKMLSEEHRVNYLGWEQMTNSESGKFVYYTCNKIERGSVATDYSPAPEDAAEQIGSLSSELKQTADGMTLLATKTELNSAKSELQSGINTATNKANSAQSTANTNAQTISTHTTQISALNTGLSAKVSQSDFNTLSGRVTTAENNIIAKANELSSKISSVEGKIPTSVGGRNYLRGTSDKYQTYTSKNYILGYPSTDRDWSKLLDPLRGKTVTVRAYIKNDTDFPVRIQMPFTAGGVYGNTVAPHKEGWSVGTGKMSADWTSANVAFVQVGDNATGGTIKAKEAKLEIGNVPSDWSPAPDDYDSKLATAQSEIKQTTDTIKASVSSVQTAASNAQSTANTAVSKADAAQAGVNTLDSTTVKSSSLTINADGIVMKAGKSTTDVANAIGSYFSVNQNAINLFSDKINVKGNMIVNGAITSDKIASKSINTAHLNGKIITADVIATNAITADAIKAGAVTTDKMSANSINGDRITAGTLDAAKIKAGSITASQIASGTITSSQIKAGGISAASIAAGAITTDKIAAGAIDASKIAANAISANMITGGKLNSTNGATVFDLNAGTLTFNNNYGYIQRSASDKVFEITTYLGTSSGSQEYLTSAFNIRKSDNSRQAGVKFTLYNTVENKPTAEAKMNADALILYDSQNTRLFSVHGKSTFAGGVNFQGWGDIPIAKVHGGLVVNDIGIGGHTKSLLKIVEELCKKAGILWV